MLSACTLELNACKTHSRLYFYFALMIYSPASIKRLWQIRRVITKHGLGGILDQLELPRSARIVSSMVLGGANNNTAPLAIRIRQALEELGPIFIKLGQALSTRPDLLPADIAQELSKLQDQVPPFPNDQALSIIRKTFGSRFDEIFESVETKAMASASVDKFMRRV